MSEITAAVAGGIRTGSNVAYLSANWLDQTNSDERPISMAASNTAGLYNGYRYDWITPTYGWTYTTTAKIRLTLSDVEHMRKVAANDAKLKAALQKIAPHIEVVVDFP